MVSRPPEPLYLNSDSTDKNDLPGAPGEEKHDWTSQGYMKHSTISRDQTQLSDYQQQKLSALRDPESEASALVQNQARALHDHELQLMLLEQQNRKRLQMAQQQRDHMQPPPTESSTLNSPNKRQSPHHHREMPPLPPTGKARRLLKRRRSPTPGDDSDAKSELGDGAGDTYKMPRFAIQQFLSESGTAPTVAHGNPAVEAGRPPSRACSRKPRTSKQDRDASLGHVRRGRPHLSSEAFGEEDLVPQLEADIAFLKRENESLKQSLEFLNHSKATFETYHRVDDGDTVSTYLDAPSWVMDHYDNQVLKGTLPVSDFLTHARMRKDNTAFVVVKEYRETESEASDPNNPQCAILEDPTPDEDSITFISDDMIDAFNAFTASRPCFKTKFPHYKVVGHLKNLKAPYLFWYYYRSHNAPFDGLSPSHTVLMKLLTSYIEGNYKIEYEHADDMFRRGRVSLRSMGYLVQPGDVLVSLEEGNVQGHVATSWCVLKDGGEGVEDAAGQQTRSWRVDCWRFQSKDNLFKKMDSLSLALPQDGSSFDTEHPMESLNALPLKFSSEELKRQLEARGKMFWTFRTGRVVSYDGSISEEIYGPGERLMVDFDTYGQLHKEPAARVWNPMTLVKLEDQPCEPDVYVFPPTVIAFNFRRKKWVDVEVDRIRDVEWNKIAFENLVLNKDTKEIVQALVTNKIDSDRGTDLIDNKGNGLIMLLHGGPGTGKTFTAESVAELAEKPLYPVTCGDIGTNPESVEKYLESVFHLGKLWGCVVLLDEADVFLEQRTLSDLQRNALVSVFLRTLEYYDGILILTSNRVGTFDEAFKSRIQLALHYENLGKSEREQIWRNFFRRLKDIGEDTIEYGDVEEYYGELAEHELNGRQIRNSITIARQLAQFRGRKMMHSHLAHAIRIANRFDTYVKSVKEGWTDDQIARTEGIR